MFHSPFSDGLKALREHAFRVHRELIGSNRFDQEEGTMDAKILAFFVVLAIVEVVRVFRERRQPQTA